MMEKAQREFKSFKVDHLEVNIYSNRSELGQNAGLRVAEKLKELLAVQESVAMVFAAASSQNEFLDTLSSVPGIDWPRVVAFHMDEYIGLPEKHPQLFANYLRSRIMDKVRPGRVFFLNSNPESPLAEVERYSKLLKEHPLDISCLGIGENGHIAFNDPEFADFNDPADVKVVAPNQTSRMQQVHDGCFKGLADVPTKAFTLTIPVLTGAKWVFGAVPGSTKKDAVQQTLAGPIATTCPASILRKHAHAVLFLDKDSAAELE